MSFLKRLFCESVPLGTRLDPQKEPLLTTHQKAGWTRRSRDTDNATAWLVALGIFWLNFVIQGMGRVAAIFYVDFMQVFEVNRKAASAPYCLQQSTRMLSGPVVGILGQQFGITTVIVLGCLIAAASSAACYFAEGIGWIIILWGGVYGLGTALTGTVNLILIEQYFFKHRSSATGLAFSGTSFGAIFFPALLDIVIQKYGIRGTFLLMGSIILYVIPIAMLLKEKSNSETKSATQKSSGTSSKYSSFIETEESLQTTPRSSMRSSSDVQENTEYNPLSEAISSRNLPVKESVPSTSQVKDLSGRTSEAAFDEMMLTQPKSDFNTNLGQITNPVKHGDKNRGAIVEPAHKSSKQFDKDYKRVSVKLTKSKNSESSNTEASIEISGKVNSSEESEPSNITELSKDASDDGQKDLNSSLVVEIQEKCGNVLDSSKTEFKSSTKHQKRIKRKTFTKKSKTQKCIMRTSALKVSKEQKLARSYENLIDFKILHENSDLVIDLLANKIPLDDEEMMPSSSEITQSNLESSDTEFISRELRRIDHQFQQPDVEVHQFLTNIQEKLKKFNELLHTDRNQFLQQKNIDFDGKELVYKDIRNTTIRKPNCTIEITEYAFEIPVDLYIPVKLQEFNDRSSKYLTSHYSGNKRIFKILNQLKRMHEIFNTPVSPDVKHSSKDDVIQSKSLSGLNMSSIGPKQTTRHENTFKNCIRTAFKLYFNPMFLLLCLCRGLTVLTFVPVVTSVVDFTIDKGMVKSEGTYAVVALSVGDLIGRLCTGWVTDRGFISEKNYMIITLILQGVCTAILPRMYGITLLLPALGIFALFQGALFVKHPVVLMKYLRRHEKYIGLGFMNFFAGVIGLVIPYYIGYFRDNLGSYDKLYYINGGLSGFVGLLWILEPVFSRFVPAVREGEITAASL